MSHCLADYKQDYLTSTNSLNSVKKIDPHVGLHGVTHVDRFAKKYGNHYLNVIVV